MAAMWALTMWALTMGVMATVTLSAPAMIDGTNHVVVADGPPPMPAREPHNWVAPSDGMCATSASATRTDSAMIDIVDRLSNAPAKSLNVSDVEKSLGVKLMRVDGVTFGEKYTSDVALDGTIIGAFISPSGEIRLSFNKLKNHMIADWCARLTEKGWVEGARIRFPFVEDAFYKNGREIFLKHDTVAIESISVLGLNTSRDE